jgi:hypothetical protein
VITADGDEIPPGDGRGTTRMPAEAPETPIPTGVAPACDDSGARGPRVPADGNITPERLSTSGRAGAC